MQPAPCFKLHHRYLLVSEIPLEDLKNVPYFGRCQCIWKNLLYFAKPRYNTKYQILIRSFEHASVSNI